MVKEPRYFQPWIIVDPVINLGSLSPYDFVETPYAHEEPLDENSTTIRNTGLENRAN